MSKFKNIPEFRIKITGALGSLLMLLIMAGCSNENQHDIMPASLAGKELHEKISGEKAATMIARLHQKPVAPAESAIGYYGKGENPTVLYVSRYDSEQRAQEVLTDMSNGIGKGSSGFWHHQTFDINDRKVHMVLGQGQVHYFFVKDHLLYWLAVQPEKAQPALSQLLDVPVSELPFPGQ